MLEPIHHAAGGCADSEAPRPVHADLLGPRCAESSEPALNHARDTLDHWQPRKPLPTR
ncbi:MAG: hypothetical protein ABIX46_10925 [Burkholderiaceae bacterium]